MKKITTKEAKQKVKAAISHALETIEVSKPSRKTKKLIKKVSKKLTSEIKANLKKGKAKVKSAQKKIEKKVKSALNHRSEVLVSAGE